MKRHAGAFFNGRMTMDLKRIFHKEGIKVLPVIQHCWTGREWHENVIAYLRVDFQCSVFSTYVYVRSAQNTWTRSLSYIEYTYASLENSPKTHFYTFLHSQSQTTQLPSRKRVNYGVSPSGGWLKVVCIEISTLVVKIDNIKCAITVAWDDCTTSRTNTLPETRMTFTSKSDLQEPKGNIR